MTSERETDAAALVAMLGAAAIIAHQVAAKATRDALFLSTFKAESLPAMYIGAALFSIALVLPAARLMAIAGPARVVPAAFCVSGALHLLEWTLISRFREIVSVALYLHFAGLGAVLISGFWSMVNERFDPHTAKKRMGQIAGGGTLGALAGGLAGASLTKLWLVLPVLSVLHLLCGWLLRMLGPRAKRARSALETPPGGLGAGARLLVQLPYLRHLALLVLLGAAAATMMDQVFKTQAQAALTEKELLRFFALFYTAASLTGCAVHTTLTRRLLENAGLGVTVSVLPAAVAFGSLGASLVPGLPSASIARGTENVVRNSLFRSGYELFYTSVPPAEKRSAKQIIDVGFERLGDMLGAVVNRGLLWMAPAVAQSVMLAVAAAAGMLGIWVARRLDRGYVSALERSLRNRAVELELEDVEDQTTRATLIRTIADLQVSPRPSVELSREALSSPIDPVVRRVADLRSRDPDRVRRALGEEPPDPALAAQIIPLLSWDEVAEEAIRALRRTGPGIAGQLADALLDSRQDFAVRRRIPRVLSVFPTPRAMDALLLGLNDSRFEVRFRCGEALLTMFSGQTELSVTAEIVFQTVSRELDLGRHLWETYRLLDGCEVDRLVGDRASRGLAHVVNLLSLALPKEPLRICFRALHTDDQMLRGTALEYLETVLPASLRERLGPLLEDRRPTSRTPRTQEEVLASLLASHESIQIRLQELRATKESQP